MFAFDPTVNLGTIITTVAFIIGAWRINNNIVSELKEVKVKLDVLWKQFERSNINGK
jgi:hypothetical protein